MKKFLPILLIAFVFVYCIPETVWRGLQKTIEVENQSQDAKKR
jgi:hypothetical protein